MAERTKFSAYCIYSAAISLLIYPISGHWIWGGGWLSQMGFHDFAGSTAVHMVGGICALIGAKILGPRIGKYGKDGKPRAILGHNLTFAALGIFILWFCWFGFNGASTIGMDSDTLMETAGRVFFNTNMAAAVVCCTTLIFTWLRYKKPDVSMTYNAALAGLVGITAGCDAVSPVGAVSVHCVCGATGTILTGLFATGVTTEAGLFYGGGLHFLGVQVAGVLSVAAYVAVIITIVFLAIKYTIGLRADYRGVQVEANLLPKVQVDIVVSAVPVRKVIETAKKVLYTGHIDDGKIFVYDVENVVKVRTGEEGFDALQDVE